VILTIIYTRLATIQSINIRGISTNYGQFELLALPSNKLIHHAEIALRLTGSTSAFDLPTNN
jgi:hypothetical protein